MIGYLISPLDGTVQRVTVRNYKDIYKWIDADCFDVARFAANGDGCFVDDNGLLVSRPPDDFFTLPDYPQPLAGKGLVLGVDDAGESISPKTDWLEFVQQVRGCMVLSINGEVGAVAGPLVVVNEIKEPTWPLA